jgi:lipopolysaccharide cholinephosphotransferase
VTSVLFAQQVDDFLPEYQNHLFEMLNDLAAIINTHNLTWWLDGGTLLGLVRSGGFIPWDDDMDISLPRNDYIKLMLILKEDKQFNEKYSLLHDTDNPKAQRVTKLYSEKYTLFEDAGDRKCLIHKAFVDIFAYDVTNGHSFTKYCKNKMLRNSGRIKGQPKKADLLTLLLRQKDRIVLALAATAYKLINSVTKQDSIYLTICKYNAMHNIADVLPVKPMKWDNLEVMVPNNYPQYCINLFGNNYMNLPPKEKRISHALLILRNVK